MAELVAGSADGQLAELVAGSADVQLAELQLEAGSYPR